MTQPDTETIEKIAALAGSLPAPYRTQLLELIGDWREDIRQSPRHAYHELLNFTSDSGSHYGQARDISGTGLFIATPAGFTIGEHLELILTFISAPNPVHLGGTVVRKTDEGIGVHFDEQSRERISALETIISEHALILRK